MISKFITMHPLYRELQAENKMLRERNVLITSARGSDYRPGANCDSEFAQKFAQLEQDYLALEKDLADERMKNLAAERRLRALFAGILS